MERVKTGIKKFDELVEGGFPRGFNVLLTGAPGTGKTIFGLQYLYNGLKEGENGIYISMDSNIDELRTQAKQFGLDFSKYEKQNKFSFLHVPVDRVRIDLFEMIEDKVETINAQRLVFDNLATFMINIDQFAVHLSDQNIFPQRPQDKQLAREKDYEIMSTEEHDTKGREYYSGSSAKRTAYLALHALGKLFTTNLIITFASQSGDKLTMDGVSEFACDGLVHFEILETATGVPRIIQVRKLRETNVCIDKVPFEITKKGIVMKSIEDVMR